MIKPTIGRIVWYRPKEELGEETRHAAMIAFVHNNELVNLFVIDSNGVPYHAQDVTLIQDPEKKPSRNQCEWMPFQQGQAAKYDVGLHDVMARLTAIEQHLASGSLLFDDTAIETFQPMLVDIAGKAVADEPSDSEKADKMLEAETGVSGQAPDEIMILARAAFEHVQQEKARMGETPKEDWSIDSCNNWYVPGVMAMINKKTSMPLGIHIPEFLHDQWLQRKIADGWVYAEETNHDEKMHSKMVPWAELSDNDKQKAQSFVLFVMGALDNSPDVQNAGESDPEYVDNSEADIAVGE